MPETTGRAPQVPGYDGLTRIGSGGFSTVYRAYEEKFDRVVALKILNLAISDPVAQRRFIRECQLMGRLGSHPHVVTVFNADVLADDRPFIAMEYLEGGTASDVLPLDLPDVLRVGVLVGSALVSIHDAGVVHRDVKPPNILFSAFGQPVLGDFGVSGIVQQGGAVSNPMALSPLYASPEAFQGLPQAASDQFSLGASLYALLAGRAPFEGDPDDPLTRIMLRILEDEPAPLALDVAPQHLQDVLHRTMAKDPAQRYPSVADVVAELQDVQADLGLAVTAMVRTGAPERSAPVGGSARVTTRPPLGEAAPPAPPAPPRTPVPGPPPDRHEPAADPDHTRPAAWPEPVGSDGRVGPDPAPPSPPPVPARRSEARTDDMELPVPSTPSDPSPSDGARADAPPRRRGNSLTIVLAILVVGLVVALVSALVLSSGTDQTEAAVRDLPTNVRLSIIDRDDPTRQRLVWSGDPDVTYVVERFEETAAGQSQPVGTVTGTTLDVDVELGVGTCFMVAAEDDLARVVESGSDLGAAYTAACTDETDREFAVGF